MAGRVQLMKGVGRLAVTRTWWVIGVAIAVVIVGAVLGGGVGDRLTSGGFLDDSSESSRADDGFTEMFEAGPSNAAFLVDPVEGFISGHTPQLGALMRALQDDPQVAQVQSPVDPETDELLAWPLPPHPRIGFGGRRAVVSFTVLGDDDDIVEHLAALDDDLGGIHDGVDFKLTGAGPVAGAARETAEQDVKRAEAISAPVTLIALLIVFGGLVAALLPLMVAVVAIIGTFVVLTIVTGMTDVSIFARSLTTFLGLGLGIDYSLFVVSRYREELRSGHKIPVAIDRTLQTAGRTVLFSAATVAASLAALFMFPIVYLRSFAFAGIAVVTLAALTAVIVLPAVLVALGPRIDKLSVRQDKPDRDRHELGFWGRQAQRVMRHPLPIAIGVTALLVVVGLPFSRVALTRIDDRVLPEGHSVREAADLVREDFSAGRLGRIEILVIDVRFDIEEGSGRCRGTLEGVCGELDSYTRTLFNLDDVENVSTEIGIYSLNAVAYGSQPIDGAGEGNASASGVPINVHLAAEDNDPLAGDGATKLALVPGVEPISPEGEALVQLIRSTPSPFDEVMVTGQSARLVDTKDALTSGLPWAIGWIAASTFVVLLLMTGTPLIPLKALLLNMLSLTATYGALVWIFQDGHMSGVLDFTATGGIDAFTPILLFCIAFGLSMDYEVFLLSRIKEEYDLTMDNDRAVAVGLGKTGGIVTAAAVLLALVFGAMATSGVVSLKMIGVGMVIAVLSDAFLIRATLVPAYMKLTGRANWWAPQWMRRWHLRYGIWEREPITITGD